MRISSFAKLLSAVTAILLSLSPAICANTSANEAMEGCRFFLTDTGRGTLKQINEQGFCRGAVEALLATNYCPPENVTIGQAVRVVVQYIDNRPARLNEPFAILVSEALKQAWPCIR
jgi:Rap1a immunity proteins